MSHRAVQFNASTGLSMNFGLKRVSLNAMRLSPLLLFDIYRLVYCQFGVIYQS